MTPTSNVGAAVFRKILLSDMVSRVVCRDSFLVLIHFTHIKLRDYVMYCKSLGTHRHCMGGYVFTISSKKTKKTNSGRF